MVNLIKKYNLKSRLSLLLILTVISLIINACAQQDIDITTTQQETQIEKYVTTLGAQLVVVNNGVWRAVMDKGIEGVENEINKGDSIVYDYAAYLFSSGKGYLYDTNIFNLSKTLGTGLDLSYFVPRAVTVGKGKLISGLDIGLIGAKKGERSYVIFSARHGFGNVKIGMIPKLSPLLIEVWVREVKKN